MSNPIYIHLDTIDSTNNYAKQWLQHNDSIAVISAKKQSEGRGLSGNKWISKKNSNLIFSIAVKHVNVSTKNIFYISVAVSVAIAEYIKQKLIASTQKVFIKWPNDIYVNQNKICGILIESNINVQIVTNLVIGIGINVNQTEFPNDISPTSLKLLTNIKYNLSEELNLLTEKIIQNIRMLNSDTFVESVWKQYYKFLLFYHETHTYLYRNNYVDAAITHVDNLGQLHLQTSDDKSIIARIKEIVF